MAEGSGSSSEAKQPGWLRLAVPSMADLIFVALLTTLVFSFLAVRLLGDADIGWQIRTGQLIWTTHTIPHVDPFSSTMAGKSWYAWEWLYDLIVGRLDTWMGLNGVVWFSAILIATTFGGMFCWLLRRGVSLCLAFALLLLALSASMIHFLARPHLVSWVLGVVWFVVLDRAERRDLSRSHSRKSWLWILPLLMLVWVNAHGGFLLGFVLLGIFWLAALWDYFRAKASRTEDLLGKIAAERRVRELTWAGLASAAASFVNPYGWKLHQHIYSYLSDRFLMNHIQEFQSPDFHGIAQRCFLGLLLVAVVVLAYRGRNIGVSKLLVVLFAVYAGLYASRNIPVSSLLLVMVLGPLVSRSSAGFFHRMSDLQTELHGHLWPIAAVVVTAVIAVQGGRVGSAKWMDARFDPKRMPVQAVDYLAQHEMRQPVLSPDSWGGYLIYRLYPERRVVVDDRHDLYGAAFFKSYLNMIRIEPGWQDFLRGHDVTCVLFPRDSALASMLRQTPGWKSIYEDEISVLFVRNP
jgi:hypothetical protein